MLTKANVVESAVYLKEKLPFVPEIALVLGSGIGPLADEVENPVYVPYGDIPHFKVSTAPDHAGRMVCGTLAGRRVSACRAVCTAMRATRRTRWHILFMC